MTSWIDLEGIMLNGISQTEKDNCFLISHVCRTGKNNNKWINIRTQKQTHRYREQIGVCQKGEGGERQSTDEGN